MEDKVSVTSLIDTHHNHYNTSKNLGLVAGRYVGPETKKPGTGSRACSGLENDDWRYRSGNFLLFLRPRTFSKIHFSFLRLIPGCDPLHLTKTNCGALAEAYFGEEVEVGAEGDV